MKDLQSDDVTNEVFKGRDAGVLVEEEFRQFDPKRLQEKGNLSTQCYVESLVTGNFMKV